jgi:hypothetical protein
MGGAFMMGACMLIIALLTKTHPPNATGGIQPTGVASITLIYIEASEFNREA